MMATKKQQVAIAILSIVGVLVLIVVGLGIYGYQRYYVPMLRPLMYVTVAGQLEQTLPSTSGFQPPASGAITPEQWAGYCDVETSVEGVLGQAAGVVARQRDALEATATGEPASVAFLAAIGAFREIGPVYLKAKQAQIEALKKAGVSLEEYRWVRRQALLGAGLPLVELDLVGMRTAPQAKRDRVEVKTTAADPAAAAANGALVSAKRTQLDTWLAMAFFDL